MNETEWVMGKYVAFGSAGYLYGGPRLAAIWLLVSVGYQVARAVVIRLRDIT
jgi:hypothetical protein